jgi:hypothetical protein
MVYLLILTCVGCGDIFASLVPFKIATYSDLKSCEEAGSLYVKSITIKPIPTPNGPKASCIPVPSRADVINSPSF